MEAGASKEAMCIACKNDGQQNRSGDAPRQRSWTISQSLSAPAEAELLRITSPSNTGA